MAFLAWRTTWSGRLCLADVDGLACLKACLARLAVWLVGLAWLG
jgi:hypothetical protein